MREKKIAIVGGGIAGASTALFLGSMGLEVTLFERESSLVNGPPFCHLHAGGNLYPDISDEQCITLLKQSIDFAKLFPQAIDHRPTVIALPKKGFSMQVDDLLPRLHALQDAYWELIKIDPSNQVLGTPEEYFRYYSKEKLLQLQEQPIPSMPQSADEWMISLAKELDFEQVQFPLIMVQEYGINLFRTSAILTHTLEQMPNITLKFNRSASEIQHKNNRWCIEHQSNSSQESESFDYLINATGFRTGIIDEMIGLKCQKMVEFKAAYIAQWQKHNTTLFPEVIFHGERGTPHGMGQFTPYPDGYFQLHGMTKAITLYPDGLVKNTPQKCHPELPKKFLDKIEDTWEKTEIDERTQRAIKHLGRFIPNFCEAQVGSKPLYGAQQIPGDDPSLRVAEVAFPTPHYARCEIVKVSSVIDMADAIIQELKQDKLILEGIPTPTLELQCPEEEIDQLATQIALDRSYPKSLARLNNKKHLT